MPEGLTEEFEYMVAQRKAFVAAMRAVADMFEQNTGLPVPNTSLVYGRIPHNPTVLAALGHKDVDAAIQYVVSHLPGVMQRNGDPTVCSDDVFFELPTSPVITRLRIAPIHIPHTTEEKTVTVPCIPTYAPLAGGSKA
jgi:hypothetical protein